MDFEEFLEKKKICSETFKSDKPAEWIRFKRFFDQVSPESFYQQKRFLINKYRQMYPVGANRGA